jgi:hypothetical protein
LFLNKPGLLEDPAPKGLDAGLLPTVEGVENPEKGVAGLGGSLAAGFSGSLLVSVGFPKRVVEPRTAEVEAVWAFGAPNKFEVVLAEDGPKRDGAAAGVSLEGSAAAGFGPN